MRRWALATAAGLLAACAVPAVSGASTSARTRLHITPATVRPGTTVVVRFTQPLETGLLPGQRTLETLSLGGAFTGHCVGAAQVTVPVGDPGAAAREALRPGRMSGGRWCVGVHHVALVLAVSSTCPPITQVHACPQFALAPATVARASFRVTRG